MRIDAAPEVLEGDPGTRRVLLLEFPGRDAARPLYWQPEDEQIRALRDQAGDGRLWLLDGV